MSGWVIDRHVTPGEFVSEQSSIYVISDLSTVWANLAVYPKDLDRIEVGQKARITAIGATASTTAEFDYITAILDFRTRSATARVTLDNPDLRWRPGVFVHATVSGESGPETLVVENDAVQYLDEKSVVFVADGVYSYRLVDVVTGDSDDRFTQILSGLEEGAAYVSNGAFELKAKIITSNLDPRAGHGH